MKRINEIEALAAEIADAARKSFLSLFKITVRFTPLERDMRQASPPGRGRL